MSRPLQPGVRLLRRLCHPSHTLAFSRPQTRPGGIGLPKFHGVRRIAVPLGACYRPGASGITYRSSSTIGTKHHPFWVRCVSHFHLFGCTIFHPPLSLVTIGTRSGRSTGLWLQVAALLSLGFPPSQVPLVNAGQLDLTPLFMCSPFYGQSIRHVKWRRPRNPVASAYFNRLKGPSRFGKLRVLSAWIPAVWSPLNRVTVLGHPASAAASGEPNHSPR
jgi:hypothetical protein